jgi:CO/xanthine dehydrogenase Mo-binding subunit
MKKPLLRPRIYSPEQVTRLLNAEGLSVKERAMLLVAFATAPAPGELWQTYTTAYIAHAPLEPRSAVAEWQDGVVTVWTGTKRPFGVRDELVSTLRLPTEKVRVIVPDAGSGYGGKHTGKYAVEAARLARGAGKPLKLVWTREEELTWAYYRPAALIDNASTVDASGRLVRWEHRNYNSGNAALRALYEVADRTEVYHPAQTPLRQGSCRSLAGSRTTLRAKPTSTSRRTPKKSIRWPSA